MEQKKFKDRRPQETDNDSDSNDIICVSPTDHDGPNFVPTLTTRDQRLKMRGIKKTLTAEERSDQILREAGIDTTGMSKQEKREFVKVIMMSKDEVTPQPQKAEENVSNEDIPKHAWNSSDPTEHTLNRRDDNTDIYKSHEDFTSQEHSSVDQVPHNDDIQDNKSTNKPQRTRILAEYSKDKVIISRHYQRDTKSNVDESTERTRILAEYSKDKVIISRYYQRDTKSNVDESTDNKSTFSMEDKDVQQTMLVKDAVTLEKQKTKRGHGKRTTTQPKSVPDERPKKQRKMEQYSHIVIDDDIPNKSSDMMDQRNSPSVWSAATEDDDTQPPGTPDVFNLESSEDPEGMKVESPPEDEDETTQEMNYIDQQQYEERDQDIQMTPEDDSACVQHRLAGRTPPPRKLQQIHQLGDEVSANKKCLPVKIKNQQASHKDKIPSETKVAFNFRSFKNKVVEMAHTVQNKFMHKEEVNKKGGSSDEPDLTTKDSSSSQEGDFYDVPALRRHYRRAKKVTPRYPFYAPDPGSVLSYTKVILQLMEIYSRKLTEAQTKAAEMIAWGEPVKCGRHVEKTLDFAPPNRSRQNIYKEESSEEDEFVPYRPRSTMRKRPMKLKVNQSKGNDDPDYVPEFCQEGSKALMDMDTQPFGDGVAKTENVESTLIDNNKYATTPKEHNKNNAQDESISVKPEADGWLSVEKQKNQPHNQSRLQTKADKLTDDCGSETTKGRTVGRSVTHKVHPVRRTMYTDIPANPGAVKKKEPQSVYNLADDNSGDELLTLKKDGANYNNKGTKRKHSNLQRKLLERSDSGYSIETLPSDDETGSAKHEGTLTQQKSASPSRLHGLPSSPYLQSESSMDSLSQQSAAMINAQGELYSTQMCIQRERSAGKRRKQVSKQKENDSHSMEGETTITDRKRKRVLSGKSEKQRESIKEASSAKGSSIDSSSDKSNDSAETQDYVSRVSPSFSTKSTEELPVLREEPTLVNDMITPTDSPENEDQADNLEKMDSQSPNFKKGRSSKKLKISRFRSVECDDEVSFKESPDIADMGDITPGPAVPVSDQQISTSIEETTRGKRSRQHRQEMNLQKKRKQEPVSLVPCPLCSVPFPQDQIEAHAAECEGSEVVDESNSAITKHSAEDVEDVSDHYEMPAEGPMGFFQTSPRKAYSPSPKKHQTIKGNDISSKDLAGEITEPGARQILMCYLCDEKLPMGPEYDQHIERCLMEAQQRQAEADARGYTGAKNTLLVTPEKRSTRSRVKEEQANKLLGRLDQAWNEGYTSATEEESCTLDSIIRRKAGKENVENTSARLSDDIDTDSSGSYSDSSSSDWDQPLKSIVRSSQAQRPLNKGSNSKQSTSTNRQSDALPGDWSLEELTNSPLKTFVPINAQENPEGFINQFDNAKRRFENRAQKKPRVQKKGAKKRRRRKKRKSTAKKPAAKRRKTNNADVVHIC